MVFDSMPPAPWLCFSHKQKETSEIVINKTEKKLSESYTRGLINTKKYKSRYGYTHFGLQTHY